MKTEQKPDTNKNILSMENMIEEKWEKLIYLASLINQYFLIQTSVNTTYQ